ncbi:Dam family site-specific DNA-(adenine-N6)-methyltransferase [candidate division KSB3 bacterium]|uniref:Site-specific DNA-methyltransferase (adenine-specific) n=1 Tax=candidate division KSB3 bacterium TaxID=2044937 RepID=A0A9D5Q6W6_9BACT|nr:Dam family site-specific DNA-(adenine-N6)-methyltransferase [candidate division KSB3 bacterium]MBD3325662.1 Dam family site-specific DNA-(adenine-N6)-methyltransferase [candidate division KSB3 bacterium]
MNVKIPPIKCQGIKSKLVPWIRSILQWDGQGRWIEPFMGSGVVGLNISPLVALFCDSNPHIIRFYQAMNSGALVPAMVRKFLTSEGKKLSKHGKAYYYEVRERFNQQQRPLDFLFLNRSCFNGMIRFNAQGKFNVPYGHKPQRFSKAYITKIVNQVEYVAKQAQLREWTFRCQDFQTTLTEVHPEDVIYCDPPYAGRHVDYFNGWTHEDEVTLYQLLKACPAKFILSTWHHNQYRHNSYIESFWSEFHVLTREHFYHIGAKEKNRNPMVEALVMNFEPGGRRQCSKIQPEQMILSEKRSSL